MANASNTIESIKRQLQTMKGHKEDAFDRAEKADAKVAVLLERREQQQKEKGDTLKRISQLEAIIIETTSALTTSHEKLQSAEKFATQAEKEVMQLQKKISDIEESMDKTETKLKSTTEEFNVTLAMGEDAERTKKTLEARYHADVARLADLEKRLAEAIKVAEASDKRYEDVSEKISALEIDLERAEDRADTAEYKQIELQEECRVLSNVMKSLEASEQEAKQREENFAELMREYSDELKETEDRADLAERTCLKLQKEVDRLEEELTHEREKFKAINDELQHTVNEVSEY
jgi:tropomyosin 1